MRTLGSHDETASDSQERFFSRCSYRVNGDARGPANAIDRDVTMLSRVEGMPACPRRPLNSRGGPTDSGYAYLRS